MVFECSTALLVCMCVCVFEVEKKLSFIPSIIVNFTTMPSNQVNCCSNLRVQFKQTIVQIQHIYACTIIRFLFIHDKSLGKRIRSVARTVSLSFCRNFHTFQFKIYSQLKHLEMQCTNEFLVKSIITIHKLFNTMFMHWV